MHRPGYWIPGYRVWEWCMIFVLSGEGPTDLGSCKNAQGKCSGDDFDVGSMTVLIEQLVKKHVDFRLRGWPDQIHYLSERTLCEMAKKLPNRLQPARSKKKPAEMGYFYTNALVLGVFAKTLEAEKADSAIAVLFRDCDSTRSVNAVWDKKWKAILDGFNHSQFDRGVPMLPKPTSEAWLLSAAQAQPYQNCQNLEDLPGNEASPNHPKRKLDAAFGARKTRRELCEWLDENPFDPDRAGAMPSFKAFRDRLDEVVLTVLH
jgi:hypothetical protein